MMRFRRYRIFTLCAFVVVVLLYYHVSNNSRWESAQESLYEKVALNQAPHTEPKNERPEQVSPQRSPAEVAAAGSSLLLAPEKGAKVEAQQGVKIPDLRTDVGVKGGYALPTQIALPTETAQRHDVHQVTDLAEAAHAQMTEAIPVDAANGNTGSGTDSSGDGAEKEDEDIHVNFRPGPYKENVAPTTTSTAHWEKQSEWFPVPEESIIPLPTGKPKSMPKVQYDFGVESDEAKGKREARLAQVKAEAKRAWQGYKRYAWTHDEVKPVSKQFRDPFCGWAATLVDSLDTLWIMGMAEEFDDAVQALKDIDFTTTPYRNDIPVFETVIRYVGGLLAAYDVTGGLSGKYHILLDKAVELAEVLMSIFDTPNRMPVLYYQWNPRVASNPRRAPTSASVAEIGSLSMEFTRLAQLTGEDKYYDAVARITDALEELQTRGTTLPGIFPQLIDASGCNMTATREARQKEASEEAKRQVQEAMDLSEEPGGYLPNTARNDSLTKLELAKDDDETLRTMPVPNEDSGSFGTDEFSVIGKRAAGETAATEARVMPWKALPKSSPKSPKVSSPGPLAETPRPIAANGLPVDWDCVPQGLVSGGYGSESYSMGGSQDSAYEYLSKQYILLGGLEPKYKTMHENVIQAVKKYLLFRPMIKDDRDILFSARVSASKAGKEVRMNHEYEVTHLTCFLGGMFGLSGKTFGSEEDVEIGKRLADGCAWAYEVFPMGIMPEYATALPCTEVDECHWNQTFWERELDSSWSWREQQMEDYYKKKAQWDEKMEEFRKQEISLKEAEEQARLKHEAELAEAHAVEEAKEQSDSPLGSELKDRDRDTSPLRKRDESSMQVGRRDNAARKGSTEDAKGQKEALSSEETEVTAKMPEQEADASSSSSLQKKPQRGSKSSGKAQKPSEKKKPVKLVKPVEPIKPLTHKEYVASRIENEGLRPGFTQIHDRRYILRPEAIESVWYMYRITGDPAWQEKGWRMFEAIIRATRASAGHSAIGDVINPQIPPLDNMESFWLAETLKYFYLLYETPDVISLDEWVLNTEAHPFRRPR